MIWSSLFHVDSRYCNSSIFSSFLLANERGCLRFMWVDGIALPPLDVTTFFIVSGCLARGRGRKWRWLELCLCFMCVVLLMLSRVYHSLQVRHSP